MKQNNKYDIGEDEIRIIRPNPTHKNTRSQGKRRLLIILLAVAALAAVTLIWVNQDGAGKEPEKSKSKEIQQPQKNLRPDSVSSSPAGFVSFADTIVNGNKFTILTPYNATPSLHIGGDILDDTTAVLVVQAANVRGDNGEIAGAYVYKGNLKSKGKATPGFCAIIDGKLTIGVSPATPLLEEAIESDGYFFRQFPLVVGGQIVENKPKGKSQRKALADLNGTTVVIMSHDRLTFHDFAQSLVGLGVSNAIYMVGSTAYGFARKQSGEIVTFGERVKNIHPNANYLVWR